MWGSDLFDLVYQAILDPERFDDLAAALAAQSEASADGDGEPERFAEGFRHASVLLHRLAAPGPMRPEEFLVAASGRIVAAGTEAEAVLGAAAGGALAELDFDPKDRNELLGFCKPGARARDWRLVRCAARSGDLRLVAAYGPETGGGEEMWRFVLLDGAAADIAAPFGAAFGLTEAEREVAVALLDGFSPSEIAARRGTTLQTVRTQIKVLLRKTGAEDMRRLVRMAAAVARGAVLASRGAAPDEAPADRLLTVGRRTVEWMQAGDPGGSPVLHVHGALGGMAPPVLTNEALARAGLRWIAAARPGHGRTDPAQDAVGQAVEDALAVMDAAGAATARLCVFSTGLPVALALAARAPGRFTEMLILSGAAPYDGLAGMRGMTPSQRAYALLARNWPRALRFLTELGIRRLRAWGPARYGEAVFGGVAADRALCREPGIARQLYDGFEFHVAQGPDAFMEDARLINTDWRGLAEGVRLPMTWLHGAEDRTAPCARAEAWAHALGARFEAFPETGHLLPFQHPGAVLRALGGLNLGA